MDILPNSNKGLKKPNLNSHFKSNIPETKIHY